MRPRPDNPLISWAGCPSLRRLPGVTGSWLRGFGEWRPYAEALRGRAAFAVVVGSSRVSTIPGLSIAGPSPEATLLTPTLDAEYLLAGRPLTLDVIPVSPEGLPTPALITRAVLSALRDVQVLVVDAGCSSAPRVPHIALPSRRVGGRIDVEPGLGRGAAEALFGEARLLGSTLARGLDAILLGESIPGGTTLAAAILEALGYRGLGRVSSSSRSNPHGLRERVVRAALSRLRGGEGLWERLGEVGDPVHVSLAGVALGALEAGARVVLAGGTQMAAVLAILSELGVRGGVAVATTPWIIRDETSDLLGLVRDVAPWAPVLYAEFSLRGSRFPGLRAYEEGWVKEGVGAGGALVLAAARGLDPGVVQRLVEEEYVRVTGR